MKFKCKLSGTVIEFTHEVDIQTTLQNENYEVCDENEGENKKSYTKKGKKEPELGTPVEDIESEIGE